MENPDAPRGLISLYLHVPFCAGKCLYCDFYSTPKSGLGKDTELKVISETIRQARFFLEALGGEQAPPLETLYIGGGTPSVLSTEALDVLLSPFRGRGWKEWTVEANPESMTEGFLASCSEAGVTRLSLGIQSMREAGLKILGRPGSLRENQRALELVASRWSGEVSLDFIAGIPGQTTSELRQDLAVLEQVNAGHASLYSLTLEPGTGLAAAVEAGRISLNDPEEDEELWFAGKDELERRGFQNYEISNFCRPGKASVHNLRYWNLEPYLGAGPGSVSTLPVQALTELLPKMARAEQQQAAPPPAGSICRLASPQSLEEFLVGQEGLWGLRAEIISPAEFLLENLMMGLRLADGIPAGRLEQRFGVGFEGIFPGLWAMWVERGLALPPGDRLRLSEQGRLLLDPLLGEVAERVHDAPMPTLVLRWA